ncbi:hypothetical protein OQA88_13387 [Cercophora sp. LCS_1]
MLSIFKSRPFNAEKDIPPLDGKVILVTGGNVGLGKQAVVDFAKHNPREVWIGARSAKKAEDAATEIRQQVPGALVKVLELDLASFESIKNAANTFMSQSDRLDVLMCNAGVMALPPGLTKNGYEIQFGTNHLGHAFLFKSLLPVLSKTAASPGSDVRIVSLASYGHTSWPKGGLRYDLLKTPAEELGAYSRYYQSKLANVLWARQLAKEYPQFTVASVHPGVVQTQIMARATETPAIVKALVRITGPLLQTVDRGVRNQLWASVSKDVKSGEYYEPVGVSGMASADGKNDVMAQGLWEWTEKELASWAPSS